MSWLILNAGSSSLKFAMFGPSVDRDADVEGKISWSGDGPAEMSVRAHHGPESTERVDASSPGDAAGLAIRTMLDRSGADPKSIRGVGHRVVHGGPDFRESAIVDGRTESAIRRLSELAPLHNPPAVEGIDAAKVALPGVPNVAAFDTTFFADLPRASVALPVPARWADDWGIRRYGFHGISHRYCSIRAAEMVGGNPDALRVVVCHLGSGCSASAVRGGKPVDTTMSFTPIDGLVMGTRSGSVDPGALIYLLQEKKLDVDAMADDLNHHAGLAGLSRVSSDYRKVEEAARKGDDHSSVALEVYVGRLRSTIGALAASLGGIDVLVFAGGVGEHSSHLRAMACGPLQFLGVEVDPAANEASLGDEADRDVGSGRSKARVLVVRTREEWIIAGEARRLVAPSSRE